MPVAAHALEPVQSDEFDPANTGFLELASRCLDCHSIDEGTEAQVGPSLEGVVGRRVAGIDSYGYSAALYRQSALGKIWDEATLNRFLEDPRAMAPGVAMQYAGVPDAQQRGQLIAWLASGPAPLPVDVLAASDRQHAPEVEAILQMTADIEYGKFLAGQCQSCHFAPGASGGVPPITGLPAPYFLGALLEYQQGARDSKVMQTMSESLGSAELAALAAFYSLPAE